MSTFKYGIEISDVQIGKRISEKFYEGTYLGKDCVLKKYENGEEIDRLSEEFINEAKIFRRDWRIDPFVVMYYGYFMLGNDRYIVFEKPYDERPQSRRSLFNTVVETCIIVTALNNFGIKHNSVIFSNVLPFGDKLKLVNFEKAEYSSEPDNPGMYLRSLKEVFGGSEHSVFFNMVENKNFRTFEELKSDLMKWYNIVCNK